MEKKHVIKLTPQERKRLLSVVSKGQNKASVIRRAHILLKSDEGKTDRETSELLYISQETVRRTRRCFCQEGLNATLAGQPHPGGTGKLDEYQEAYLIALACSDPPDGQARWTLKLLAKQLVNDSIVEGIAPETVRLVLKKTL